MSKELEALKDLIKRNNAIREEGHFHIGTDTINIIKKALTPPTADEVCMALSEWLITKVVYKHKTKTFYLKQSTFNVELVSYYYDKDRKDYVIHFEFAEPLPPHLITLIGRFYEV